MEESNIKIENYKSKSVITLVSGGLVSFCKTDQRTNQPTDQLYLFL